MKKFCARLGLALLGVVLSSPSTRAALVYVLTDENDLLSLDSAAPQALLGGGAITGLGGQDLVGIDFRPANGQLYGVGNLGGIFSINTTTRAATPVSTIDVQLQGSRFGVDFNPVPDRLRIVSDVDQNLRVNVDTGVAAVDAALNPGNPNIVGAAYTNSYAPSPRATPGTTLYTIDSVADQLLTQNPPNNGTQNVVGSLGINVSSLTGFDILAAGDGINNTAFAALQLTNEGISRLYSIHLGTGLATNLGEIGGGDLIDGLAVALPVIPEPSTIALAASALIGCSVARRRRR